MSSKSKQTEAIRQNKERKHGKQSKRARAQGTTKTEAELFGNTLKKK